LGGIDACFKKFILDGMTEDVQRYMWESILIGSREEIRKFQFSARVAMKIVLFKADKNGMELQSLFRWWLSWYLVDSAEVGVGCREEEVIAHNLSGSDDKRIQCRSQKGLNSPGRNQREMDGTRWTKRLSESTTLEQPTWSIVHRD
jgi:hypothetical protein